MVNILEKVYFSSEIMEKHHRNDIAHICHLCLTNRTIPSVRMKDQQGKRIILHFST